MKRRMLLSLVGIGLSVQTAGCMQNGPAGAESDETADQSSENTETEQDSEDEGPLISNEEESETEQDSGDEEPIISNKEESETQQQQEQHNEREIEEQNNEQNEEDEPQEDTDESTTDVGDMRVFVEHKEKREVISGATVIIRHRNAESAQWQGTTETHRYQGSEYASVGFQAIPTGTYTVFVRADGFIETSELVEVTENGVGPVVQLSPAESTILFTVKDQYLEPHKNPVPGADIDITYGVSETATVTTNEQGEARFTAPQPGEYTYSVRADGFQTPTDQRTETVEDDTTISIVITEEVYQLTVDAGEKNAEVKLVRLRDGKTDRKTANIEEEAHFEVYPGEYKATAYLGSDTFTVPETTVVRLGD